MRKFFPTLKVLKDNVPEIIDWMSRIMEKNVMDTFVSFSKELTKAIISIKQTQLHAHQIRKKNQVLFHNPMQDPNNVLGLFLKHIKEAATTWNENPKIYAPYFPLI